MFTRKTKIVCSIGPACDSDSTIRQMILSGMNIARFNFSHGSYEWHRQAMQKVRQISTELGIPVAILLDTKGPEIRTGLVENDGKISINAGEKVELISDSSYCTAKSDSKICHISLSCQEAPEKLIPGVKVLIADGLIELEVNEISGRTILCTAANSGTIITNCGNALSQLIQNTFRRAFLNANKTIYHINGKQVTANDFTMDFYMKIASKKTGINFKTLLVA